MCAPKTGRIQSRRYIYIYQLLLVKERVLDREPAGCDQAAIRISRLVCRRATSSRPRVRFPRPGPDARGPFDARALVLRSALSETRWIFSRCTARVAFAVLPRCVDVTANHATIATATTTTTMSEDRNDSASTRFHKAPMCRLDIPIGSVFLRERSRPSCDVTSSRVMLSKLNVVSILFAVCLVGLTVSKCAATYP